MRHGGAGRYRLSHRRVLRRDWKSDVLPCKLKTLTLHRRVRAARLSLPDLKEAERDLFG